MSDRHTHDPDPIAGGSGVPADLNLNKRGDLAMLRQAIRGGWFQVPEQVAKILPQRLLLIAANKNADGSDADHGVRSQISAAQTIIMMLKHNMETDKHLMGESVGEERRVIRTPLEVPPDVLDGNLGGDL